MRIFQGCRLRDGRHSSAQQIYLVTTIIWNREPLLADFTRARCIIKTMQALDRQAIVDSMAFVVMPDHVHWLLGLREKPLADTMRLFKGRSARVLNQQRLVQGSVWQTGYHDHALRKDEDILAVARYIVANPVRENLVTSVKNYPHWDAIWL